MRLVERRRPGKRLRWDRRLAEELAYCVPLGLPHSEFLGWDETDRDKAIAWLAEQRETCDRCGTRESDWVHDGKALTPPKWDVDTYRCPGCAQIDRLARSIPDEADRAGLSIRIVPRRG